MPRRQERLSRRNMECMWGHKELAIKIDEPHIEKR